MIVREWWGEVGREIYLRWHPSSAGGSGTPAGSCREVAASTRDRQEGRLEI